jgi:hypothetical protein
MCACRRNDHGTARERQGSGPLRVGSIEVSFNAPHPIRSVLPVVADLAATDEAVVAHPNRARNEAERERGAEATGGGVRPGVSTSA